MGSGKYLRRAFEKYGIENFKKEILFIFDNEEDMNAKEKELVVISEETYNLCDGGQGGFSYISKMPTHKESCSRGGKIAGEIHKEKMKKDSSYREKFLDIWQKKGSKAFVEKYPEGLKTFLGKKHSREWKQKMSIIMKEKQQGTKNSQYGTCWITNGQEDKKIKKEELDLWVELGYTKGRKINCNQHR